MVVAVEDNPLAVVAAGDSPLGVEAVADIPLEVAVVVDSPSVVDVVDRDCIAAAVQGMLLVGEEGVNLQEEGVTPQEEAGVVILVPLGQLLRGWKDQWVQHWEQREVEAS